MTAKRRNLVARVKKLEARGVYNTLAVDAVYDVMELIRWLPKYLKSTGAMRPRQMIDALEQIGPKDPHSDEVLKLGKSVKKTQYAFATAVTAMVQYWSKNLKHST